MHQKLQELVEGVLHHSVVLTDDTVFEELPGWDSVAHINLMFALEQAFGIEFSHFEISELQTVRDLTQVLEAKPIRAAATRTC